MARRIVMLGAPASGNGTQAARLAKHFGLPDFSTGALIRSEQHRGSNLGRLADRFLAGGGFLPDDLIIEVMLRWLGEHGSEGFVLDGFPRTLPQAAALDQALADSGHQIDAVALLETDLETLRGRCAKRLHCSRCGGTFGAGDALLTSGGKRCPEVACQGTLEPRRDDEPETYAGRLANYQKLTQPLIRYYSRNSILTRIDGSGSPDVVFGKILTALGALTSPAETN